MRIEDTEAIMMSWMRERPSGSRHSYGYDLYVPTAGACYGLKCGITYLAISAIERRDFCGSSAAICIRMTRCVTRVCWR